MKTAYLGADVSKGYADFVLLDSAKQPLCSVFKLGDTRLGHDRLINFLRNSLADYDLSRIICGVESTGGYENNWYYMLSMLSKDTSDQVLVRRLNPRGVKAEKEASLVRSEDDGVSALAIATHLINQEQRILESSQNSIEFYQARKFYRYIQSLIKDQSRVKSRAEKLIYESFPELLGMVKSGSISKWMVNLLVVYPSAQRVAKAQINSLAKIKGISKDRAERLKVKAQQSIAAPSTVYMEKAIQGTCGEIKRAEAVIKKNKDYLADSYTNDDIDLLVRIKGLGDYSSIGLVMEIEDVNRYAKASSVSAYFGLYPEMKVSGDGSTKPRMSKKGRASCRAILYMAARNLVLHNPYFKAYHQRQRDKGMCYNAALGVVMNKIIRVAWGILKSRKPFDPKVDIANQKSTNQPSRTKTKPVANEEQLMEAPISARKRKKLKAMKESQEPVKVSSTRSSPSPVQT